MFFFTSSTLCRTPPSPHICFLCFISSSGPGETKGGNYSYNIRCYIWCVFSTIACIYAVVLLQVSIREYHSYTYIFCLYVHYYFTRIWVYENLFTIYFNGNLYIFLFEELFLPIFLILKLLFLCLIIHNISI